MKLNEEDQQRLHQFYIEAFDRYGDSDARSVQWTSPRGQLTRFRVLLQVEELEGKSILDVGCGLGDLYKVLLQQEINAEYTGIDIVPEFISAARKRFPMADFETKDIFEVSARYDVVLASGASSFKVENNQNYYRDFIKKMYDVAYSSVAFNLLDKRSHVDNDTYAAYDVNEIADYCSSFAGNVEIVTDYLPRDFTVYLTK